MSPSGHFFGLILRHSLLGLVCALSVDNEWSKTEKQVLSQAYNYGNSNKYHQYDIHRIPLNNQFSSLFKPASFFKPTQMAPSSPSTTNPHSPLMQPHPTPVMVSHVSLPPSTASPLISQPSHHPNHQHHHLPPPSSANCYDGQPDIYDEFATLQYLERARESLTIYHGELVTANELTF